MLRERRALRRARHVMAAAKELGLRPAARSKAGVSVKGRSSEMDRCVFRVRAAGIGRRGHLQSLDPSRVALLESRSSTTITSAIVVSRRVPLESWSRGFRPMLLRRASSKEVAGAKSRGSLLIRRKKEGCD